MGIAIGLLIASGTGQTVKPSRAFHPSLRVTEGATADQVEGILTSNRVAVLDFSAAWCGPCQQVKPIMHEIADKYGERVKVVTIDIDNAKDVAKRYQVQSIPDVRIFVDGQQCEAFLGARPMETYTNALETLLKGE